jgi:hypothetical protein
MSELNRNKPTRKDRLRLIISGVQKHFPKAQVVLARQTFNTVDDLVRFIQADIDITDATDKARADWRAGVQKERDSHQKLAPLLRSLKAYVTAQFGDTQDASSTLADFGYAPRKVAERPVAAKSEAAAKVRATRTARHTMGKNQKKAVKGTAGVPAAPAPAPGAVVTAPGGTNGGVSGAGSGGASTGTPAAGPPAGSGGNAPRAS